MRSVSLGAAMIVISLGIGMLGFLHYFPKMGWADAFVNASMLLSGVVPLAQSETTSAGGVFRPRRAFFELDAGDDHRRYFCAIGASLFACDA